MDDLLGSFRWYDALCFNQDDVDERSQQVRLMRDIYSQAWQVVVWLGEDYHRYAAMAIDTTQSAFNCFCLESGFDGNRASANDCIIALDKIQHDPDFASSDRNNGYLPQFRANSGGIYPLEWQAVAWLYNLE